jgi:hypothetical protein
VPLNHQLLSLPAMRQKASVVTHKRLGMFLKTAPRFKINQTLAQLMVPLSSEEKMGLEAACEQALGPNQAPQVLSGIWVDAKSTPIFAYFAQRVDSGLADGETQGISMQYQGRTQADLDCYLDQNPQAVVHYDGLNVRQLMYVTYLFALLRRLHLAEPALQDLPACHPGPLCKHEAELTDGPS